MARGREIWPEDREIWTGVGSGPGGDVPRGPGVVPPPVLCC